ncbi:MAG TPA: hypothetical protein VG370_34480 [Chloroflexota bacterium]|nr:hypothetical protein [Chloroflexota bacterium]
MDTAATSESQVEVVHRERSATQILVLVILMAAVYGAGLYVTRGVVFIPGVTWFRPANALSELYGVNFGLWGALAAGIGNTLNDILGGEFNLVLFAPIFILEVVCTALIPYWIVTDPTLRSTRGKIEWLVGVVILQGLTTGFGIAAVLVATGTVPSNLFFPIGQTISLNEGVPAIVAGVIQYALFPQLYKMGLYMGRRLEGSNAPADYVASLAS